jgi:hypothetical protein
MFLSGLKEAHQEVIELPDEISPQVFLLYEKKNSKKNNVKKKKIIHRRCSCV